MLNSLMFLPMRICIREGRLIIAYHHIRRMGARTGMTLH